MKFAWLFNLFTRRPPGVTYYTTDGGKLAPYPDMTDDDLADFERWVEDMERHA